MKIISVIYFISFSTAPTILRGVCGAHVGSRVEEDQSHVLERASMVTSAMSDATVTRLKTLLATVR